jgi:hypothetical protein
MDNVFYIYCPSLDKKMKYKNKILIFNFYEEVQMFANNFMQYAMTRAIMENIDIVPIIQTTLTVVSITPSSKDSPIEGEETINFETLKENIKNNNGNAN